MKTPFKLIVLFLLISNMAVAQQTNAEFPKLTGSYLGQTPPGMIPELFAPGIVSTKAYEHGSPIFSKDLTEIYWTTNVDNEGKFDTRLTYMMKFEDGVWTSPEVPEVLKDFAFVDYPFITPNGTKFFFSASKKMKPQINEPEPEKVDIYFAERMNGEWSEPVCLDTTINLTKANVSGPTVSENGNLYFTIYSYVDTSTRGMFYSEYINDKYAGPKKMGAEFSKSSSDYTPYVAPDESYLIFSSRRAGSLGMGDLYISFKKDDGSWGEAINMGNEINTERNERFPNLSPDGKYLFFNSSRTISGADENGPGNGTGDVYWISAKVIEKLRPKK